MRLFWGPMVFGWMVMPMIDRAGPSDAALGYEVQALLNGKWNTEAAFDDAALAESEAMRLFQSKRQPEAVRVVRNVVDPATHLISANTVFRRSRAEDGKAERQQDIRLRESAVRRKKMREQAAQSKKNKNQHWLIKISISFIVTLIILFGFAHYYNIF